MTRINNLLYKVFHSAKDTDRDYLWREANNSLQFVGKELDTPTVLISGPTSLKTFLTKNPDFNIDLKGYDPRKYMDTRSQFVGARGIRVGWRYGEIGVWASNWVAWKTFLNTDADYLLLVEDDGVFTWGYEDLLHAYMQELPEDWDQFHLWAPVGDRSLFDIDDHGIGKTHVCKAYQNWSNTAYVLSRRGAKKLLDDVEKNGITLPLDWLWFKESYRFNFGCYTVTPESTHLCYNSESVGSTFQWQMKREDLTNYDSDL